MKNTLRLLALTSLVAAGSTVGACSSDTTTSGDGGASTSTTPTTTPGTDAGTPPADGGGGGATPGPELNGCKTYVDRTADSASRTITWGFSVSSTPEACMKIKAGQTVTWNGELGTHPLAAKGGDANSPIKNEKTATFAAAGTFGYVCTAHASMTGVVLVVP